MNANVVPLYEELKDDSGLLQLGSYFSNIGHHFYQLCGYDDIVFWL